MEYTLEDLRAVVAGPVDVSKWGNNTRKIVAMINDILKANCSSCMLKRKVAQLNSLMSEHGDSVKTGTYRSDRFSINNNNVECPDCTAKHISQSYVLQGEFYQGYTENLPLIESHIEEAIRECPKDNKILHFLLNDMLKSVTIDKNPKIPVVLAIDLLPDGFGMHTEAQMPQKCTIQGLYTELYRLPTEILKKVHRLWKNMPEFSLKPSILELSEISGRLACISEIVAQYSVHLARILRAIRLWVVREHTDMEDLRTCNDTRTKIDIIIADLLPEDKVAKTAEKPPKNA